MRRTDKNIKGIALIAVMLVIVTLTVLTTGFAAFTTTDYAVSQQFYLSTSTFYLAQAGLEYAQYMIRHNMLVFPSAKDSVTTPLDDIDATHASNKPYHDITKASQNYVAVGEACNLFNGEEHLVISQLSYYYDDRVADLLGSGKCCGTFYVSATTIAGSGDARTLVIKSIGKVRDVVGTHDPTTEDYTSDTNFPVKAKRTLYLRIPYRNNGQADANDLGGYEQSIPRDSMYEKTR